MLSLLCGLGALACGNVSVAQLVTHTYSAYMQTYIHTYIQTYIFTCLHDIYAYRLHIFKDSFTDR